MVAATRRVDTRCATKLSQVTDQRVIEQSSFRQILDQGSITLVVHGSDDVLHALDGRKRFAAVNIPGDFVKHGQESVDSHKSHTSFNQPPRQQAALTEAVHTIFFSNRTGFRFQVKGLASSLAGHQAKRCFKVTVQQLGILAALKSSHRILHDFTQLAAPVQSCFANLTGGQQVRDLETVLGGIGH